jgi:hypothetical protein
VDGGRTWQALAVAPWKLPLIVIAIAVPIAFAFYAGGGGAGMASGALAAVAIVVVAARQRPRGAIGKAPAAADRRRLLVVAARPLESPGAIAEVVAAARPAEGDATAEVLILAPARAGFLDRWASDLEGARREAQRRLVISAASLAKAGVAAEARVGDEDLVQAVEDQLQSFAATDVILVTAAAAEDPAAEAAAAELSGRLQARFQRLLVSDPSAR